MIFREAFELMKKGAKMKLPSWAGYWFWSVSAQTIIIHTKDGVDMDIRETQIPDYTFGNVCSDEWILADGENCPELGGEATFSFGEAIKYLKRGMKVARKGWNGKGMFLYMTTGSVVSLDKIKPETANYIRSFCEDKGMDEIEICPHIDMKTADNKLVIGWLASQADMLAEDWVFVE